MSRRKLQWRRAWVQQGANGRPSVPGSTKRGSGETRMNQDKDGNPHHNDLRGQGKVCTVAMGDRKTSLVEKWCR